MIRKVVSFAIVSLMAFGVSFAAPAKKPAKPAPKLVEVKYCPIAEQKVQGNGSGSRVIQNYKVFFCCAGCDTEWDKWPASKQLQVAKKLAARQAAEAKKKKS